VQSRQHAGMMTAFGVVVTHTRLRGELDSDFDATELTAAIAGLQLCSRWISRQKLGDDFVRGIVNRALGVSWRAVIPEVQCAKEIT